MAQDPPWAGEALDLAPSPMLVLDGGVIALANRALADLSGYHQEELVRLPVARLLPDWGKPNPTLVSRTDADALAGMADLVQKNGQRLCVEVRGRAFSAASRPLQIWTIADVGERHRLENEVRSGTLAREEFMYVAAHDLRNRLAGIQTSAQVFQRLLDRGLPLVATEGPRLLAGLDREARRMGRLINQLLDIARMDAGKLDLSIGRSNLADVLRQAANTVNAADERYQVSVAPTDPVVAEVDGPRLEHVLSLLLEASMKNIPEGGTVEASLDSTDDRATIRVEDEGAPIEPGRREALFERGQSPRGSGDLGLYFSRQIVGLHHGTLVSEATPSGGNRFVLTLPVPASA